MAFLILFHFHFIILFFLLPSLFFSFPCFVLTLYLLFLCPFLVLLQVVTTFETGVTEQQVIAQWSFAVFDPDFCNHH